MDLNVVLFAGSLPALLPVDPVRALAMLRQWRDRANERRLLAQFGERERHDLALTQADIRREIAKPFWRG